MRNLSIKYEEMLSFLFAKNINLPWRFMNFQYNVQFDIWFNLIQNNPDWFRTKPELYCPVDKIIAGPPGKAYVYFMYQVGISQYNELSLACQNSRLASLIVPIYNCDNYLSISNENIHDIFTERLSSLKGSLFLDWPTMAGVHRVNKDFLVGWNRQVYDYAMLILSYSSEGTPVKLNTEDFIR